MTKNFFACWLMWLLGTICPIRASVSPAMHKMLSLAVKKGEVDYQYLVSRKNLLRAEIENWADLSLANMNKDERMAFWINAYNLLTLDLIIRHHPLASIKDIRRSERWLWKGWKVAGKMVSLDGIEHDILRPMGDPRIHFAINCASFSCPVLAPKLYRSQSLDDQLNRATRRFLSDPKRGFAFKERKSFFGFGDPVKEPYVSQIFNWFAEDFEQSHGHVIEFIREHVDEKTKVALAGVEDKDLRFLDYDWSLNGR